MMKKTILIIASMLIFLFSLYAVGIIVIPGKNYALGANIENEIKRKIPIGSSKREVELFLDSQKSIEYQYIGDKEDLEFTSDVRRSKFKVKNLSGVIQASIANTGHSLLTYWGIDIVFFFDKEGILIGYEVKNGGVGL